MFHLVIGVQRRLILKPERLLRPVRILAVIVLEPAVLGIPLGARRPKLLLVPIPLLVALAHAHDQIVVVLGHGSMVQMRQLVDAKIGRRCAVPLFDMGVHPSLRCHPVGHQKLTVLVRDGIVEKHLNLGAQQIEIARVPRHEVSAFRGDRQGMEDMAPPNIAVPAVHRPPPHTVPMLAGLAGRPHIVRHDAAVGVDALHPRLDVVHDPTLVLVVPGVQIRIGHEPSSGKVGRRVAVEHELVEQPNDLRRAHGILPPTQLQLLDRRIERRPNAHLLGPPSRSGCVPAVQVRLHFVQRSAVVRAKAAVHRRPNDPVNRIVDRRFRIFPKEHIRKSPRPPDVLRNRWVPQRKIVEGHIALPHVMPLGVTGVRDAEILVVDVVPERLRSCSVEVVQVVDSVPVPVVE